MKIRAKPGHPGAAAAPSDPDWLSLVLLMVAAFCCPNTWSVIPGYLSFSDLFSLLALAGRARFLLRNPQYLDRVPALLVLSAVLFSLSGMINDAMGEAHADPLNAAKLVFSLTIFPMLIVFVTGTEQSRLDKVLTAWLAGGVLSAGVALASRYGISLAGLYDQRSAQGWRAVGLSYHSNVLGYTSALLVPVALYLLSRRRHWLIDLATLAGLGLLLAGIHLSGSRASILALGLAGLVTFLASLRSHRTVLLTTAILGAIALGSLALTITMELDVELPSSFRESAVGRVLGLSSTAVASNEERETYIDLGWQDFLEHPLFGSGYGAIRWAHMHVLAILDSGGLLGFSAFLIWCIAILSACRRITESRHRNRAVSGGLWFVVLAALAIWLVVGALQPVLPDRNGYILIGALFALDAQTRRAMGRDRGKPRTSVMPTFRASEVR